MTARFPFSVFSNLLDTNPVGVITLDVYHKRVISNAKMKDRFFELRRADKPTRDKLKRKLPCITPSAQLKSRAALCPNRLLALSGLMQFDIDSKDNPHITNWEGLRDQLTSFDSICFCSISVSGRGIYGFVPVSFPELLPKHFQSLQHDFAEMGLKLDSSKGARPTDARLYSYDPGAWLKLDAPEYSKTEETPQNPVFAPLSVIPEHGDVNSMTLFDRFNRYADVPSILYRFGWRATSLKGSKIRLRRPGKQSGVSADFDQQRRLLFVFSSSTSFLPDRAYNAIRVVKTLAGLSSWQEVRDYILRNRLL